MRRVCIAFALVCLLLAGGAAGCAVEPGADSQTEREDVFQEQEIDEGIQVNGTVVTAAGKEIDLAEKNSYVHRIARCHWIEKNKLMIECNITGSNGQPLYLAVYDVVRDIYVYEQYGKQFMWQNDDLDTLVYVMDYAGEEEGSQVLNKKNVVLYESGTEEQIVSVSYVPKGIKVELADLRGENARQVIIESAN